MDIIDPITALDYLLVEAERQHRIQRSALRFRKAPGFGDDRGIWEHIEWPVLGWAHRLDGAQDASVICDCTFPPLTWDLNDPSPVIDLPKMFLLYSRWSDPCTGAWFDRWLGQCPKCHTIWYRIQ